MTPADSIYRAVVEDQTELIRRFRPDGRLTFVNGAFCRFYEKTRPELLGSHFSELLPAAEREAVVSRIYALTPAEPEVVTEPSYTGRDGRVRFLQYVTRAIFSDAGEVVEYQSVGRDITVQKEAELTLAEARRAMERAARVTTLAVIGGGIAHEINQPLSAIRLLAASARILEERGSPPPGEMARLLGEIAAQVDRIDAIVNHLRQHLRRQSALPAGPCDPGAAVTAALALVEAQVRARDIRLTSRIEADLPPVDGPSIRIEELVINLVDNARQALARAAGPDREITVAVAREGPGRVALTVADTGPGFDPALAATLFEPFFTTKPAGSSMGLGLSIVRTIVDAAGGSVTAENRPGGGALFRVSLPAFAGEAG
ncbi:Sensory box histidine kinase [Desulfovibrio sp. DV]|uniref:PAS domain-containing sensor histidine kinase n=1 Tax=Desulfovibrio sp. DV TaxID=1844708 RepID=UPI00094BBF35|nr:ATP-binding protein [Desulfovibrio sp. DV]OLN25213.1 Sensory box histidine kinase [Desulfovibrio sp. DV]